MCLAHNRQPHTHQPSRLGEEGGGQRGSLQPHRGAQRLADLEERLQLLVSQQAHHLELQAGRTRAGAAAGSRVRVWLAQPPAVGNSAAGTVSGDRVGLSSCGPKS